MIDIHTHILPGVDDGPANLYQAVAMLQLAADAGTTDIVATPHVNSEYAFPEIIDMRIRQLMEASGGVVRIHGGCELHVNAANILDVLDDPARYTIAGRGYLLVEIPDLGIPPCIEHVFDQFRALGITPVIAHPERNPILQHQTARLESWVGGGCRLQVTAQSLLGRFGKSAERCGIQLLDRELVHCVASDAHDSVYRPPVLSEVLLWLLANYGRDTAEALLVENPAAALSGVPIAEPVVTG